MSKKQPKLENVLLRIRECIDEDMYTITTHALIRQKERKIKVPGVIHVLLNGYEEKKKTHFDAINNTWKYAIRGKTKIDNFDIRVIVSFDKDGMLIITVMHVGGA